MRTRLLVLVVLACVTGACSRGGDDDETASTETTPPSTEPTTTSPPTTVTTSTSEVVISADLTTIRWVVQDFDGLVGHDGQVLVPPSQEDTTARPTVARAVDGSLYFLRGDGPSLWRWPRDADRPEEVEIDWGDVPEPDSLNGLGHNEQGLVIVNPYGEALVVDDGDPGLRQRSVLDSTDPEQLGGQSITAANGLTVEVLPVTGDFDPEGGYLVSVDEPARLQVSNADGEVEWTVALGGVDAPWLDLIDFDGRFVLLSRAPGEPADPLIQHIVYDLDCPPDDADGRPGTGCTETFQARFGTASLVGPDRGPGDDNLNPQLPTICPTMGRLIATPAEITEPSFFDEGFDASHRVAFERAALGLSLCDEWTLAAFGADGLTYDPAGGEDGWLWTEFAQALRGPVRAEAEQSWVWSVHPDRASVVMTDEFADPRVEFRPPRSRPAGTIAVTVTGEGLTLSGQAEASIAGNVRAAAGVVAEQRGITLQDNLVVGGPAPSSGTVDDLVDAIANRFGSRVAAGEVQLTDDGVLVATVPRTAPSPVERELGFAIADFASGGEGVFNELPLADEVYLALGSEIQAVRTPLELTMRQGWRVNAAEFNGYSGPFNLLDNVPAPSEIVIGPNPRCASAFAAPAPPALAGHRRIVVLPAPDSIGSCLQWSAITLYVNGDSVIEGVGLDLVAP